MPAELNEKMAEVGAKVRRRANWRRTQQSDNIAPVRAVPLETRSLPVASEVDKEDLFSDVLVTEQRHENEMVIQRPPSY